MNNLQLEGYGSDGFIFFIAMFILVMAVSDFVRSYRKGKRKHKI